MWNTITTLYGAHPFWFAVVGVFIVTTAIGALPTPRDGSSQFYEFFFKFATGLGGGLARVLAIYRPDILTAVTGQQVKTTTPPNPPVADGEGPAVTTDQTKAGK